MVTKKIQSRPHAALPRRGRQQPIPADVQAALAELKRALEGIYGDRLRGVYLYGSYARGDFHAESDVDVLVALAGDINPSEEISRYSAEVSDISLNHNLLIGTFPIPERWLTERDDPFFQNVRRESIRL